MTAYTIQFVDSIASSPTVRLDLNDGSAAGAAGMRTLRENFNISPPALKAAWANSILYDGGQLAASAYENRTLRFPVLVTGSTQDDLATRFRTLAAELNRASNILKWQPGSTPLFFRTFRSPEMTVRSERQARFALTAEVAIEAEPFAYGLRVDQTGVSVKANPALTNGMYVDVNGVTGDVETPAYIALSAQTGPTGKTLLAVRRHGTPANLQFVYQAESASILDQPDTTVTVANDATASGAGSNTVTTTFATTTAMAARFHTAHLADTTEARGQFRVFARVKKSVGTDTITMSVVSTTATATTLASGTAWQMVDLGLVQFPVGEDTQTGYSGVYPALVSTFSLQVNAARTAGTGNLVYDYVLMIPADENFAVLNSAWGWSTATAVLDGPNDAFYLLSSGAAATSTGNGRAGSIPTLSAGNNRLYFVETAAAVGDSSTVTVSFWPRFLVV